MVLVASRKQHKGTQNAGEPKISLQILTQMFRKNEVAAV